jgi:hypothetical protein
MASNKTEHVPLKEVVSAEHISLEDVVAASGFSIEQEEWYLRRDVTKKVILSFIVVNIAVLLMICLMFGVDTVLIYKGIIKSTDRSVTEKIIMSVIAATTVQFGAIAVSISAWLFKRKKES